MTETLERLESLELKSGETTLIAPAMRCVFYFDHADISTIKDLTDKALRALDDRLTHFASGRMSALAKRSAKTDEAYGALFADQPVGANLWINFAGAPQKQGATAAALNINRSPLAPIPTDPDAVSDVIEKYRVEFEEEGRVFTPKVTSVEVTFPLDHQLGRSDALLTWISELECVKTPSFVSGFAGYGLNFYGTVGSRDLRRMMTPALGSAFARHPGLDFEKYGNVATHLLKYWAGHEWFLPRIKRVNWLTFVRTQMLEVLCDGQDQVVAQLNGSDGITCHDIGDGLIVQAGAGAEIGDVTQGEILPAYRAVASALSAARLPNVAGEGIGFDREAAQAWLTALETDYD